MRTIEINLYKFEELSKEAQQKTIMDNQDVNMDQWWGYDFIYKDAESVGLKILSFKLDRLSCNIEIVGTHEKTAMLILKQHGKESGTYEIAVNFLERLKKLEGIDSTEVDEDIIEDSVNDACIMLVNDLEGEYSEMFKEYNEYRASDECVRRALINNEYEFELEGGSINTY